MNERKSLKLPIWMIVGSVGFLPAISVLYAMIQFLGASDGSNSLVNFLLYIAGILGVVAGIPCYIIGMVLLVNRSRHNKQIEQNEEIKEE